MKAFKHLTSPSNPLLIDKKWGEEQFSKFLTDVELLKTGAVTLKELYGTSPVYAERTSGEEEEANKPKHFEDYLILDNGDYQVYDDMDEEEESSRLSGVRNVGGSVIRHIRHRGVMMKYTDWCSYGMDHIVTQIKAAYDEPRVDAVVLELDTGGGAAQSAEMLRQAIKDRNKPVVVCAKNAMSGGMWGTAPADHIVADGEIANFGSIGVYIEFIDSTEAYEKEGYKIHRPYATKSTHKNKGYEDAIKGDYDYIIKNDLDPMNEQFHSVMENDRGLSPDPDAERWANGQTYLSREALAVGLVDSIGSLQTAFQKAHELAMKQEINTIKTSTKSILEAKVEGKDGLAKQAEAVKTLNAAYAAAELKAAELTSELATSTAKVEELTTQLEEANAKAESMNEELTNVNTKNDTKVAELTTTIEANTAEIETLKEQTETLKTERDEAEAKYTAQVERTNEIIKANDLNVEVETTQEVEEQVEETQGGEEVVLTDEEQVIANLHQLGHTRIGR